jgi:phosphoglycerate kinase
VVAANAFSNDAETKIVNVDSIPDGWQGLDAGPKWLTSKSNHGIKTILWNGPLGVFEIILLTATELGKYIAASTAKELVGGGDSAAVKQFGLEDKMSYVSTGGAMLEMLVRYCQE